MARNGDALDLYPEKPASIKDTAPVFGKAKRTTENNSIGPGPSKYDTSTPNKPKFYMG